MAWITMAPPTKKAGKTTEEIQRILKDVEDILKNSKEGSAFALQLFRAPPQSALNFAGAMRDLLPDIKKVQEIAKETEEYKVVLLPLLAMEGDAQMTIQRNNSLGK